MAGENRARALEAAHYFGPYLVPSRVVNERAALITLQPRAGAALRFFKQRSRRACWTIALIVSSSLSTTWVAHAEPSASERATARSLAKDGYVALTDKDYETAEDRFRRADELVHAPTLVIDRARALVGLGRFGDAYSAFQSVINEEIPAKAPAVWKQAKKAAEKEIEAVKPRVAWLTIRVSGPSESQVELDGRPLPASSLGQRLPANPGERVVAASAEGYISKQVKRTLAEGAEVELALELLPEPKPEPVVVVTPPPAPDPAEQETERRGNRNRTLTYVAFGVSGAGLALGVATGVLWLKARSDIKEACGSLSCEASTDSEASRYEDQQQRYNTYGTLSGIGFAVGVAGAATGVTLILLEPKTNADEKAKTAHITPYLAGTSFGLRGAF
jgi:hypothetical protein